MADPPFRQCFEKPKARQRVMHFGTAVAACCSDHMTVWGPVCVAGTRQWRLAEYLLIVLDPAAA